MLYIEELESKAKPLQMGGFHECEEYVGIVHEILLHAHISHACEMEWNFVTNSSPAWRIWYQ